MNLLKTALSAALALGIASPALAEFPEKPINVVVGFRAGGGSDTAARIVAAELEKALGQEVIVENRGGAGGGVAAAWLKEQPADGYTIGFAVATTFAFDPLLGSVQHGIGDFSYLAGVAGYRSVFTAPVDAPFEDFQGMLAHAKERGWLNYASIIPLDRKIMEFIGKKEELAVNVVPTRGGAGARQAVLGGHVDLGFSGSNAIPMHTDGALRILAAGVPDGLTELPDVPSLKDLGYDVYTSNYMVFFGPPNMDEEVRAKLEEALLTAAKSEAFVEFVTEKFRGREVGMAGPELQAELERQSGDYEVLLKTLEE